MNHKEFKEQLLKNSEFKKEYEKFDLKRDIARMVVEARIIKGITQSELATLVGTKQPSIARLENGGFLPSLRFLEKISESLKTKLVVKFGFMEAPTEIKDESNIYSLTVTHHINDQSNFNYLSNNQNSRSVSQFFNI